jgi:two-component system phosphate regulon response regulator PhoB
MRRPGWVFSRQQIVDGVRGANYAVTERAVDVQVVSLRRKLGSAADAIETVRGVGYRFREE